MYSYSNGGRLARHILSCALLIASSTSAPALAQAISDPAGDFIPSFTGPKNGDLDLIRVEATFDGAKFRLDAATAAPIGTTPTGLYVWGFNRGKGTAGFAAIGATGVLFDSVVIVNPRAGTVTVRDLISGTGTTVPASAIKISGNQISAEIPANLLSPQGLEQAKFLVNLWPRSANGGNETIPDFGPDNANTRLVLAFPTPAEASVQTEAVFDDASDRFARIKRRLDAQRRGGGGNIGGFLDLGARFGTRGIGESLARDTVNRITAGGIDYALTRNAVVGLGFAANRTHADLASGGTLKANIYSPELYFGFRSGALHLDGYAAYSIVEYDSRRLLPIGADLLLATARPEGDALSFAGSIGYEVGAKSLTFTPGIDLLVTRAHVDGYAETNDQDFGAALADRRRTSARLGIGAAVRYAKLYGWGSVALHAKGRYITELADKRDGIAFAYTAQPDVLFDLQGPKTGIDHGLIEIGADVTSRTGLRAALSYAPRLDGHGFIDHAAVFTIGMAF
ncbi:hypothetical protein COC42_00530 [Sphingomonas spermidinifaciens]|uniref:Autotransporter domain-containing protein n=1 Tax=Sphingomonas spermidinifaciens TaxID=1141889 RepID=A0A2A4B3E5_9SPHN|nr:autotransporter outer membrane beta-barrel domain-containing protein [Sphingomonas spermidinifaciens]PCD02961.1 hypothetical protein COC42_00530 [Sphingomonas spermidinifaciens]